MKNVVDILHKAFVYSCIAGTFYGLFLTGLRVERFFTVTRPQIKERERLEKEALLMEGKGITDILKDSATELKV